jgi:hypothetical protein
VGRIPPPYTLLIEVFCFWFGWCFQHVFTSDLAGISACSCFCFGWLFQLVLLLAGFVSLYLLLVVVGCFTVCFMFLLQKKKALFVMDGKHISQHYLGYKITFCISSNFFLFIYILILRLRTFLVGKNTLYLMNYSRSARLLNK